MPPREPFGTRVAAAVARTGPLCAGIDPSAALLGAWGLPDDAGGLASFAGRCVEAFAGTVPVVKPQLAYFERHGAAGLAALEHLLAAAADAGLLVIADAKRGDTDSTSAAYADAWLGEGSPLAADAVTAHAYLGLGALAPMVAAARRTGRGVLVVARSSNPEGLALQAAVGPGGRAVGDLVLDGVAACNREEGLAVGSVGAVVGATLAPTDGLPGQLAAVGGVLLAPGLGAQGASVADVGALFGACRPGTVLPSVSRSVLAAGPDPAALRQAAAQVRDELSAVLA
ncbi:MAG: orotidine-5'-phosphate decarboxylase [Acidimicrobiales bacterium]